MKRKPYHELIDWPLPYLGRDASVSMNRKGRESWFGLFDVEKNREGKTSKCHATAEPCEG
ncbi:hypothetical protein JCM15831A_01900 [Asaia astilbis]